MILDKWHKSQRPQKQDAREYALSHLDVKTHTLWLPGEGCHCIEEAIRTGVVNGRGHFIFVEKNREVIPNIEAFVKRKGNWKNPPIIFQGDLSMLRLPWPIDYAFLDFLGTFDVKTSLWMAQALRFMDGADFCVTHAYGRRYNLFLDRMEAVFQELDLYTSLKHELHCYDDLVVLPLAMMKSMFNKYSFEIRWPCKYQDSVRSMLLFRLENFHHLRGTNGWPDFVSLMRRSEVMSRESAKKAWVTRRNGSAALAKKRSNAAKKAWATRRAMAK